MFNEKGERKNSITIDGAIYVLSPEEEINAHHQRFNSEKKILEDKIKNLEKKTKEQEEDLKNREMVLNIKEHVLDKMTRHNHDISEEDKINIQVKLNFISNPFRGDSGYNDEMSANFDSFEQIIPYIKEKVYQEIDRHSTHTYDYCHVVIDTHYTEQFKGKTVKMEIPELSFDFKIESCENLVPEKIVDLFLDN